MSMKHNEKVKLFATYMNGLAISLFAVGCLGVVASLMIKSEPMTVGKGIAYATFFIASIAWHLAGRRALDRLSE
jgi:hypothetical protein